MPIATNDQGDTLFLDADGQWKPAQTAVNPDTNEKMVLDGSNWRPLNPPSMAEDVTKSGGIGLVKGGIGIAGTLPDMARVAKKGVDYAASSLGASPETVSKINAIGKRALGAVPGIGWNAAYGPTSQQIQSTIESKTGKFYQPKTTAGQYAETVGEFLPGAALGPGGVGRRVLTQAVIPALASETAGQVADQIDPELTPYARVAGAVVGAASPHGISRMAEPLPISPQRAASVAALRAEGVEPTAGQITKSKGLMALEDEASGGRAGELVDRPKAQFTAAVLRRAGINADRADMPVIDQGFDTLGNQFDNLIGRSRVPINNQMAQELQRIRDDYVNIKGINAAPVVANQVDALIPRVGTMLSGPEYQSLRSDLGRYARQARGNPDLQDAIYEIQNVLDNGVYQGLNSQALRNAWQQVRRRYRNMLVVERAVTTGGAGAGEAFITPAKLRAADIAINGRRSFARGRSDYAQLARHGEHVLVGLPNSGTPARQMAWGRLAHAGGQGLIGGAVGSLLGGPIGAGIGAGIGLAEPVITQRLASSPLGQAYLGGQFALPQNFNRSSRAAALAAALRAPQIAGSQ